MVESVEKYFTISDYRPIAEFPYQDLIEDPDIRYFRQLSCPHDDSFCTAVIIQFFEHLLLESTPRPAQQYVQQLAETLDKSRRRWFSQPARFCKFGDCTESFPEILIFLNQIGGNGNLSRQDEKLELICNSLQRDNNEEHLLKDFSKLLKKAVNTDLTPGEDTIRKLGEAMEATVGCMHYDTHSRVRDVIRSNQNAVLLSAPIFVIQTDKEDETYILYYRESLPLRLRKKLENVPALFVPDGMSIHRPQSSYAEETKKFKDQSEDQEHKLAALRNRSAEQAEEIARLSQQHDDDEHLIKNWTDKFSVAEKESEELAERLKVADRSLEQKNERIKQLELSLTQKQREADQLYEEYNQIRGKVVARNGGAENMPKLDTVACMVKALLGLASPMIKMLNEDAILTADLVPPVRTALELVAAIQPEVERKAKPQERFICVSLSRVLDRLAGTLAAEGELALFASKVKRDKKPGSSSGRVSLGPFSRASVMDEEEEKKTICQRAQSMTAVCTECKEPINSEHRGGRMADCRGMHMFHVDCLRRMLKKGRTLCPEDGDRLGIEIGMLPKSHHDSGRKDNSYSP